MLTPRRRAFGSDLTNVLNDTPTRTPRIEKGSRVPDSDGCEIDFAKRVAQRLIRRTELTQVSHSSRIAYLVECCDIDIPTP